MSLALYRHVRLLPDAALKAVADLVAVIRTEGTDPALAFELVVFEHQVRGEAPRSIPLAAEAAPGATAAREAATGDEGTGAHAASAGRPPLTKPCLDCPKVRVASCRSALAKMGPRCQACNGKFNLARRREARTTARPLANTPGDSEPAPDPSKEAPIAPATLPEAHGVMIPLSDERGGDLVHEDPHAPNDHDGSAGLLQDAQHGDLAAADVDADHQGGAELEAELEQLPQRHLLATTREPPRSKPGTRPSPARAFTLPASPEPGPVERTARRFKCGRPTCAREFIAEAEKGKEIPFCPDCRHTPPVIREERVVGDGTGGLEQGRVYYRKVLAPAGWRDPETVGPIG